MSLEQPAAEIFRYNWKKGTVSLYSIKVKGEVRVETSQGLEITPLDIEMRVRQKVEDVNNDLATINMLILTARARQNNDVITLPEEGQASTLIIDRRGKTESIVGSEGWQGAEAAQMEFPDKPLKPGDSWIQKNRTQGPPVIESNTKYTYIGTAERNGKRAAVFEAEMLLDQAQNSVGKPNAFSRGRTWFDMERGQILETTADSRFTFFVPVPDQPNKLACSTTIIHTEMKLVE